MHNKMAKWIAAFLFGLLMLGAAMAEDTVTDIPASRIVDPRTWSIYLAGEVQHADGEWHFHIDTASTDWTQLVAACRCAKDISVALEVKPYFDVEKNQYAKSYRVLNWYESDRPSYEEIKNRFQEDEDWEAAMGYDYSSDVQFDQSQPRNAGNHGFSILTYQEQQKAVLMAPVDRLYYTVFRWYDENKTILADEIVKVTITYSDNKSVKVGETGIPQNRLLVSPDDPCVETVANGKLVFRVPLGTESYSFTIKAPEEMPNLYTRLFIDGLYYASIDERLLTVPNNGEITITMDAVTPNNGSELNETFRLALHWSNLSDPSIPEKLETLSVLVIENGKNQRLQRIHALKALISTYPSTR